MSNKCAHCGKKLTMLSTHLYKGDYLCVDCLSTAKHDQQYDFLNTIAHFTPTKKYVNELKQEGLLIDDIRNELAIVNYRHAILDDIAKTEEINRRVQAEGLSIIDAKELVETEQREFIRSKIKYKVDYNIFPFSKILEVEIIEDGKSVNRETRKHLADEKLMKEIHYGEIKDFLGFPVPKDKGEEIASQIGLKLVVYSLVQPVYYIDFFNRPGSELLKTSDEYKNIVENIKYWFEFFADIIHVNDIADKELMAKEKNANQEDFYELLKKLALLKSEGILTEAEFNEKKADILSRI